LLFVLTREQAPPRQEAAPQSMVVQDSPAQRERGGLAGPQTQEVLHIVKSNEVEIVHVSGADIRMLLAGQLPWSGPMLLVQPHEVEIRSPMNDQTGLEVRMGSGATPIILMPLAGDDDQHP
jgi:hypothetical protein